MKHKMAEFEEKLIKENTMKIQSPTKPANKEERNNNRDTANTVRMCREKSLGLIQDEYEKEFERIMQEQENQQQISHQRDRSYNLNSTMGNKTLPLIDHENKIRHVFHPCRSEPTKLTQKTNVAIPSVIIRSADEYPSELNPFDEDERKGCGTNPFGDSDEEETPSNARKGCGTNPFGDSDEEETPNNALLHYPQPLPRDSVATTRPCKEDQDNRIKLPVPLPRTLSRSMPSTPNQSPLLHANRSFRLPGSSSSLARYNTSAYSSIRRKKKPAPAPPPPNNSLPNSLLSFPSPSPSPTISNKSNNRPRKSRMAPQPPTLTAPCISKLQHNISSLSVQDSKK